MYKENFKKKAYYEFMHTVLSEYCFLEFTIDREAKKNRCAYTSDSTVSYNLILKKTAFSFGI